MLQVCILLLSALHVCLSVDLIYYVPEDSSPGTYLGDIAIDSHLMESVPPQDQELITFSQMTEGSPLFRISKKSGKLYTAQMLDAESMCKPNKECFKMVDVAVRKKESFIKVLEIKVVVKDVNDHQPEFPVKEVNIKFSEDDSKGVRRAIPNAIDKDVGYENSQITYELKKNEDEPFTLSVSKNVDGTSKLGITLEERLNREVKDCYNVQVIAEDGGSPPKQSILDVHISVTDVNDNSPAFSRNVYNVSIRYDHEVGTPVAILSAIDLDAGRNGKTSYHFSSKTSDSVKALFDINKKTGEISLRKQLTSGKESTYELYIEATDGGSPPLNSIAMVQVNVISQKNNPPSIDVNFVSSSNINTATISEDIAIGSFIAYVKVTDYDLGRNGEVSCDLRHPKFQLQSLGKKKYKITVKNPLDRETEDHHEIIIICQDKGSPPLHSEAKFSIQVMDVNDMRPQFSEKTFKFCISENHKPRSIVGTINATDLDIGPGGKLTYSLLTDKKNFLPFQISDNGVITTIISLDHEFQNIYKFQVFVKDNGIPAFNNTVKVIVEVKDENDNAPYFTFPTVNPYSLDVLYYPHHTHNITVLKASDIDSRENAFLRFEIHQGNDKQLFAIDHYSGLLSFSRVATQADAGAHYLEIVVKDSGNPVLSAKTNLSLMVTVSNKTFASSSSESNQSDQKIHMFLLIVIVLVSVTISVPVTAAISICIIRYKNCKTVTNRSADVEPVNKHEQRHLMCATHQEITWADAPGDQTDSNLVGNSLIVKSRRGICPGDKLVRGQKGSCSGMRLQSGSDVIYQEIDESDENDQRHFMFPDTKCNIVFSHTNTEEGWSDGDTRKTKQFQDCFSGEACKSASAMNERDYRRKTLTKSMQQRFLCPEVTNVTSRCLKTPNIGHIPDCTQWTDMRLPPLKVTNCPPSPPSPQPVKILQVPVLQAPLPLPLAKKKR